MSQHTSQPGRRRRTGQGSRPPVHALESTLQEATVEPPGISLGHTPPHDGGSGIEPIPLPPLEPRLLKRYLILVQSHMRSAPETRGWRGEPPQHQHGVRRNPSCVSVPEQRTGLVACVGGTASRGRSESGRNLEVAVCHAGSRLEQVGLQPAQEKRDLTQLTHKSDVGYELTTALLVSADDGTSSGAHGDPFADRQWGAQHTRSCTQGLCPIRIKSWR